MSPWKAAPTGRPDFRCRHARPAARSRRLRAQPASAWPTRCGAAGCGSAPHAKSHKCPAIARRQIALGAVGICCQKVSEAAVFVDGRHRGRAGDQRGRRRDQAAPPGRAGAPRAHGRAASTIPQQVAGAGRCGARAGGDAGRLCRDRRRRPALRRARPARTARGWRGRSPTARRCALPACSATTGRRSTCARPPSARAAIAAAVEAARATQQAIEAARPRGASASPAPAPAASCSSATRGVFNEIQAGSYIFMDRDYGDNQRGPRDIAFEHALFVRTTVLSRTAADARGGRRRPQGLERRLGHAHRLAAPGAALREGGRRPWRAGHPGRRARSSWARR